MPPWWFAAALACAGRLPPPADPVEVPAAALPVVDEAVALAALDAELQELRAAEAALDPTRAEDVAPLLAAMVAVDRRLRRAADVVPDPAWGLDARLAWGRAVDARLAEADAAHAAQLARLLDAHGWFEVGRFGAAADQDGWLLVQHASGDPALQRRALAGVQAAVARGQSDPGRAACLYDRVQVLAEAPQRYGTQGRCGAEGTWTPLPLEDPDEVDRWRAEAGLGTLAAFQAQMAATCE